MKVLLVHVTMKLKKVPRMPSQVGGAANEVAGESSTRYSSPFYHAHPSSTTSSTRTDYITFSALPSQQATRHSQLAVVVLPPRLFASLYDASQPWLLGYNSTLLRSSYTRSQRLAPGPQRS